MKTRSKQNPRQFKLEIFSYGNSYYIDRVAELEKAKVELWEATIEQGVLNHLMKDSSCT